MLSFSNSICTVTKTEETNDEETPGCKQTEEALECTKVFIFAVEEFIYSRKVSYHSLSYAIRLWYLNNKCGPCFL